MAWRPWRQAMAEALYGDAGFYRQAGAPARHFRTAAHASPAWGKAIAELARRVDTALGAPPGMSVVDLGAGGGELLAALAEHLPERISLVGIDLAPRPDGLPERVRWGSELPAGITGLLLAVECLDVVPVDVVEVDDDGRVRLVEVDRSGRERLAGPPRGTDAGWLDRWWPLDGEPGRRAEIGGPRDVAWSQAGAAVTRGLALAVDYAAVPARDRAGTLTGFRAGRACRPVPDGSTDITAHVLFESLELPGDHRTSQRDALLRLGVAGSRPAYDGDPASYLRRLADASVESELIDSRGLGGFTWLLRPAGIDVPI